MKNKAEESAQTHELGNEFLEELRVMNEEAENEENLTEETKNKHSEIARKKIEEQTDEHHNVLEELTGVSKEKLAEWKKMYGNKVYSLIIDDNEVYIYRYCTRPEMKKINTQFEEVKTKTNELFDELIFDRCVLYPHVDGTLKLTIGAGTIKTVATAIKLASNYIPDDILMQMITQL